MSQTSLERRLENALRGDAEALLIADGWDRIQHRIRWRPYRRATALAVAIAVLFATAVVAPRFFGGAEERGFIAPRPTGRPVSTPEPVQGSSRLAPNSLGGRGPSAAVDRATPRTAVQTNAKTVRGRIVFAEQPGDSHGQPNTIFVIEEDGSGRRQLGSGSLPGWSPDGRRIVYVEDVADCLQTFCWEIWVMNADGSQRRRLGPGARPDWSPDGKRIVFTKYKEGIEDPHVLHVMDADGSHVRSLGLAGRHPSWSPDGTKVAFVATDDPEYGCGSVRITEVDGPGYVALPSPGCYVHDPNWSPDGKRIAFSSSRGMNTLDQGIFVVNADGSGLKRLSPVWEGSEPRAMLTPTWSPDGKRIAYMFDPDGANYPSATSYYCRRIGNGPQTGWADCRPAGPLPGQITIMNADGSDSHQLTQGGSPDFSSGL